MMSHLKYALALLCLAGLVNPALASADDPAEKIVELYNTNKLLNKGDYPAVREAFANLFAAKHEKVIRKALGGDYASVMSWLDARPELRQNLFTALDARYNNIENAFRLFHDIWELFPKQLDKYPDLGIAIAVTWDEPKAVYDYTHHQERTKSRMPGGLLDGVANFKYLVENEAAMEGRLQNLPWEFLIFVVDHKTPLVERAWAQQYFQINRSKPEKWYSDVPYDKGMLKAEKARDANREVPLGLAPKLQGLDYTLENIRIRGGVCAMQADFAVRVAKSVGIPAVYTWAASARGDDLWHAWFTYVQVQKATSKDIQFTLRSHGQVVGHIKDSFYVGSVHDPHSGRKLLDADMHRWLSLAGHDRAALRHATLLMAHYAWLGPRLKWGLKEHLDYVDKVIRLCPQYDEPWYALVPMAKAKTLDAEGHKIVKARVSSILIHFKNYPDFINLMFTKLLSSFDSAEQLKLNQQAVTLCEKAGRPDLSCDLRLRISDLLIKDKKWKAAADGIVVTLYRFPTEGRYVPKLTQKMQDFAGAYKEGNKRLADVYIDLVPRLYTYYRGDADATAHKMLYAQAMSFFESNKMTDYAQTLKARTSK